MFSFIQYLHGLLEKLKKNKGLWFTTITVVSIIGILFCLYIITSMTSNVSEKVYNSMSDEYIARVDNHLGSKEFEYKTIVLALSQDKELLGFFEKGNDEGLTVFAKTLNESILKNSINNFKVLFHNPAKKDKILRSSINSVVNTKNSVYGIDTTADGIFNVYLKPLVKDEKVYGVIEIRESIHNYRKYFENLDDQYVFLLDKKMLPKLSVATKQGRYRDMNENYVVAQTFYDTKFSATIPEIEKEKFSELISQNYLIDGIYYRTYKTVTDINGVDIGIMVLGEIVDKENGFVNIADNMTKTVTMVSLGLVISIMLFMF
ncbi:MAG: hypothetical protein U9Q04_04200 [Campylobacterota bacterium]|nr:hypothetical protein [Campylobacterota bacterium]